MAGDTEDASIWYSLFSRTADRLEPNSLTLSYQLNWDTAENRLLVTQPLAGHLAGFEATVDYRLENGEVILHDMTFRPRERTVWNATPAGRAMRAVRIGHVTSTVMDMINDPFWGVGWAALMPDWVAAFHKGRRTGRGGTSLLVYAVWAKRRMDAQEANPKAPIRWLCEKYGESPGAVNAFVYQAREKGLLEGTRGTVKLTQLAERLLATPEVQTLNQNER